MKDLGPASVVLTTYNDPDVIERTLAGFARQDCRDFELVVADDGSSDDYSPILRAWAGQLAHGIQHVRQEDKGFRRARILNRAIHASRFDRIIFSDMDCLPHPEFVQNHLLHLKPGTAVTGRRVHLEREVVPSPQAILEKGLGFGFPVLLGLWVQGKAKKIEHGFVSPMFYESPRDSLLGSNFSMCKSDLEAVNGFNEEYEGWGSEDSDLDFRIKLNGVRVRNLRNKVIQYHLIHPKRNSSDNRNRLERTMANRVIQAPRGLRQIQEGDFERTLYRG